MKGANQLVRICYYKLRMVAAIYLSLPVIIFLGGFLKWYFAIPGVCTIFYSLFMMSAKKNTELDEKKDICVPFWTIIAVFILMLVWTHLGGMNGYWYQSSDYSVRNAILRDLITHAWPVTYQNGSTALVYYIGHWLPSALIGKIAISLFGSMQIAWIVAQVFLWLWSSAGLTIIGLLLFLCLKADTRRKRIIVILVLIFFSGMDIVGSLFENKLSDNFSTETLHLEWWSPKYLQYSSITTCLYWVFNQAIVPWIITMLVLLDSDSRYYMLYIASSLICAPMPTVGLCFIMLGKEASALIIAIKAQNPKERLKRIISPTNLLVLFICIPFLVTYLLCSSTAGDIEAKTIIEKNRSIIDLLVNYGLFYVLEAGVLLLLLWSDNKKDVLFYTIGISLLIIPLIHVGRGTDFCMRGSIPAIFLLMVYTLKTLLSSEHIETKEKGVCKRKSLVAALVVILLIGAITPTVEIFRGIYNVIDKGNMILTNDTLHSFENESESYNFTTANYKEQLFFSTFANLP